MTKTPIKLNQVWKQKGSSLMVVIAGKAKDSHKWKTKVLTNKPDFYAGTHTLSQWTLWKKFELQ